MLRELIAATQSLSRRRSAAIGCDPNVCHFVLGESNPELIIVSPNSTANVARSSRLQAYDTSKRLILAANPNRKESSLSTPEIAAAGFMSAIPTTLVAAPVERAKVLLQIQGQGKGSTQYTGVFDVLRRLYAEGGIKSVFRGSVATVIRDGPGSAAFVPFSSPVVHLLNRAYILTLSCLPVTLLLTRLRRSG